jgi:hypothetical protein
MGDDNRVGNEIPARLDQIAPNRWQAGSYWSAMRYVLRGGDIDLNDGIRPLATLRQADAYGFVEGDLRGALGALPGVVTALGDAASLMLRGDCSERPFVSSLSRRTISVVLRMSASLKSAPIVDAIARNRAFNSR